MAKISVVITILLATFDWMKVGFTPLWIAETLAIPNQGLVFVCSLPFKSYKLRKLIPRSFGAMGV